MDKSFLGSEFEYISQRTFASAGAISNKTFFVACLKGDVDEVKKLHLKSVENGIGFLKVDPNHVFIIDGEQETALSVAIKTKNLPIFEYIIVEMKDLLVFDNPTNFISYLHIIAKSSLPDEKTDEFVQKALGLLAKHLPTIDVNVQDKDGFTPLHTACLCGNYSMIVGLIENFPACDLGKENYHGNTPLEILVDNPWVTRTMNCMLALMYLLASRRMTTKILNHVTIRGNSALTISDGPFTVTLLEKRTDWDPRLIAKKAELVNIRSCKDFKSEDKAPLDKVNPVAQTLGWGSIFFYSPFGMFFDFVWLKYWAK
jgi:hypothetical protein